MQEMQIPSVYQLIRSFNRSDFRRKSIPQELVSGWPAIRRLGKTLCVTIPYYARSRAQPGQDSLRAEQGRPLARTRSAAQGT